MTVPALPGCFPQGETKDEALGNAQVAITGHVDALEALGKPVPSDVSAVVETVQVRALRRLRYHSTRLGNQAGAVDVLDLLHQGEISLGSDRDRPQHPCRLVRDTDVLVSPRRVEGIRVALARIDVPRVPRLGATRQAHIGGM